jgi:hypothetical protein
MRRLVAPSILAPPILAPPILAPIAAGGRS